MNPSRAMTGSHEEPTVAEAIDHELEKDQPGLIVFRKMCEDHDLTYAYSDDSRYWRAGQASYDALKKAAAALPIEDVKRIWNSVVDTKLVPDAREQFYWK